MTCVIDAVSHVYCWGADMQGGSMPRTVTLPGGSSRSTMPNGTSEVLDESGHVFSLLFGNTPKQLGFLGGNNAWFGGGVPACALKRSGSLWCSDYRFDADSEHLLAKLTLRENVIQAGTGDLFMCALTANGQVWCEGLNVMGQLGRGTTSTFEEGALVPALADVNSISLNEYSVCALKADGSVWCWGQYAAAINASAPVQVTGCTQQSKKPSPPTLGQASAAERLSEAARARGQAFCTCVGQTAPTRECIEGENQAPNATCVGSLAPAPAGTQYWNCLANNAWQDVDCYSGPACKNGFEPCPVPAVCDPAGMERVASYCQRRTCASNPSQRLRHDQICDGMADCSGFSDEQNCRTDTFAFECTPENRIVLSQLCDQKADCRDGSDEQFCP